MVSSETATAPFTQSAFEGYLKKKRMTRLFSVRYGVLSWFKVKTHTTLCLRDILCIKEGKDELVVMKNNSLGYLFTVSFKDHETPIQTFACTSRGEVLSWVVCLGNLLAEPSDQNAATLTSKSSIVFCQNARKWKETVASVRDGTVFFETRKPCGDFDLHGSGVVAEIDLQDENVFHVKGTDANKDLSLMCENIDMCKVWVNHIQASIEFEKFSDHMVLCDKSERELRNSLRGILEQHEKVSKVNIRTGKKVVIVCIDGGGTRGIIPCVILERIACKFPDFLSRVSVVAGTSAGAMIAMSLAFDHEPRVVREVIEQTAQAIFSEQKAAIPFARARWSNRCLAVLCDELFGKSRIKDATKKVAVTAFKLDNQDEDETQRSCAMSLFHNFSKAETSRKHLASDCVMRSSAAPSYFSSWQNYIDGGTFAPDPSLLCLTHVMASELLNVAAENIVLLSLSTGNHKKYFSRQTNNWGYVQWATKMIAVLWTGMVSQSQTCCRILLGSRLHRVDPLMDSNIALDEPSALPILVEIGVNHDLEETFNWIQKNVYTDDD